MRQTFQALLVAGLLVISALGAAAEAGQELKHDGRVTLEFEDVSLAEALGALAERAGKRLAVEAGVSLDSRVTLQAKDAEWRELLERVVAVSSLAYEQSGDWLIVTARR